jgi:putative transposase
MIFHVLNRGVGKMELFQSPHDYRAFESLLVECKQFVPMRILAYCLMPNHWHLVLWPEEDGQVTAFMQRLTVTHASRWNLQRQRSGAGHVYQGRFKSFPVETDEHYYALVRYVERNAARAGLVSRAEAWPWSSLWHLTRETEIGGELCPWPLPRPISWLAYVNQVQRESELNALRECVVRGCPFGGRDWSAETVQRLGRNRRFGPWADHGRPERKRADGLLREAQMEAQMGTGPVFVDERTVARTLEIRKPHQSPFASPRSQSSPTTPISLSDPIS